MHLRIYVVFALTVFPLSFHLFFVIVLSQQEHTSLLVLFLYFFALSLNGMHHLFVHSFICFVCSHLFIAAGLHSINSYNDFLFFVPSLFQLLLFYQSIVLPVCIDTHTRPWLLSCAHEIKESKGTKKKRKKGRQ